jgi:Effector Associated Constant Component 1
MPFLRVTSYRRFLDNSCSNRTMEISLSVAGNDAAGEVRSLYTWLAGTDELRGRARLVSAGPSPGALGPGADWIAVALGPGGISAAVATGLVAWLRQRRSDIVVKTRGRGGKVIELSAKRLRGLDSSQLREIVRDLAGDLDDPASANPDKESVVWRAFAGD